MISEAQRKRIFALAKDHGWTPEDVKNFLIFRHRSASTANLTITNYEWLCYVISTTTPKKAMGQYD